MLNSPGCAIKTIHFGNFVLHCQGQIFVVIRVNYDYLFALVQSNHLRLEKIH